MQGENMSTAELITKLEAALKAYEINPQKHYFSPTNSQSRFVLTVNGEQFCVEIIRGK